MHHSSLLSFLYTGKKLNDQMLVTTIVLSSRSRDSNTDGIYSIKVYPLILNLFNRFQ